MKICLKKKLCQGSRFIFARNTNYIKCKTEPNKLQYITKKQEALEYANTHIMSLSKAWNHMTVLTIH